MEEFDFEITELLTQPIEKEGLFHRKAFSASSWIQQVSSLQLSKPLQSSIVQTYNEIPIY